MGPNGHERTAHARDPSQEDRGSPQEGRPDRHRRRRRLHRRSLARYFHDKGFTRIRAVDKKPLDRLVPADARASRACAWTSADEENCVRACEGAVEVYNLAADMGGMGFIERFRVECLRSVLINTHMIEAAYRAGAERYFFSSSACAYNTDLQKDPNVPGAQGVRRLPGHGRARLRLGEAHLGDVLPGVLGRARHEDRHRPLPQRLRPLRHLGRRPREGARRHLPQGHRGQGHRQPTRSRSGATARRPAASCTSTTASRAST